MGLKLLSDDGFKFPIQSVEIRYARGNFTTAVIELICPTNFGLSELQKLDFGKVLQSPEVTKAVQNEIQKQTRKFNFD